MALTLPAKHNLNINDTSKPVVFLGSNYLMAKFTEVCEDNGIPIAGIMDSDYWGNVEQICDVPVIDSEVSLEDPVRLQYYKDNFNFFCATNWIPVNDPVTQRNKEKRHKLLNLIDSLDLPCVTLVDRSSKVSRYATIGRGVYIDGNSVVEPNSVIGDFTNIYWNTGIGHDSIVGRNCVFQRRCGLTANVKIEDNVFMGNHTFVLAPVTVASGTWLQHNLMIMRNTEPNEVVSLAGKDLRRVYQQVIVD